MQKNSPTLLLFVVLLACLLVSLHVGVRQYAPFEVWTALTSDADDSTSLIIRTLRLPRMLIAPIVGAALGVAGLLMQTVTRNPLASPALLGINAGAAFAVVFAASVFGISAMIPLSIVATLGALAATALVFMLSLSAGGSFSPVTTLLAGVTLAALLASGTQIILVTDEVTMESLLFWLSGGFADRDMRLLLVGAPIVLGAIAGALTLSGALDAMLADDQSAEALGVPVIKVRVVALVLAALLAGASVSLAGPVAFIGLVAPHMARRLGGLSHRAAFPLVILIGAILAIVADIAARFVIYPSEAPVGTVLAFVGVPALIGLLQSSKLRRI